MIRYHLAREGSSLGQLDQAEILVRLAAGELRPSDLTWAPGEPAWTPLAARPWCGAFAHRAPLGEGPALERPGLAWWRALLPTFRETLIAPGTTFRPSPQPPRILPGLAWHASLALLSNLAGLYWAERYLRNPWQRSEQLFEGLLPSWGAAWEFFRIWALVSPLLVVVGTVVGATLVHAMLRLMRGGKAGWVSTFRVLNYVGGSANLLLAVPLLGMLAGPWALACAALGLAAAHGDTTAKSVGAFVLTGLLGLACLLAALVIALLPFLAQL
ncbi:MAG: YIP1 family protein [Opitutia bacterium]